MKTGGSQVYRNTFFIGTVKLTFTQLLGESITAISVPFRCHYEAKISINSVAQNEQDIPGGWPSGRNVLLFDLQVNVAGYPCPVQSLGRPSSSFGPTPCPSIARPLPPLHNKNTLKKKYINDLSLLGALSLLLLIPVPTFNGPPNLQEVPGLVLPAHQSALQHQLSNLCLFTHYSFIFQFKFNMLIPVI